MAETTGFEPARSCPQHAFQACALNRSATSPHKNWAHSNDFPKKVQGALILNKSLIE